MSKRAANTLWHRADQVEMVKSNISRILWNWGEAPNEIQAAITHELEQLENIIQAMQQESRDERESGRRWYEEQERKEKVKRERGRIRPTGPKREAML